METPHTSPSEPSPRGRRPPGSSEGPEEMSEERRGQSELRAHYEVERELAARLRSATRAERPALYSAVYDELFRRVGSHPQRQRHSDADVLGQLQALDRYLGRDSVFLEIGAGDCALSLAVADRVREVFAIEVSAEITAGVSRRANLHVVITDGVSVPVPPAAATLAYSNQVFEHLHPDDALEHLRQVFGALQPGGRYVCITPNHAARGLTTSRCTSTRTQRVFTFRNTPATELDGHVVRRFPKRRAVGDEEGHLVPPAVAGRSRD